ncbi:DUF2586 family protein [Limibacterium fermenti]|mgnify:CR=1 FL=1|uniref:DUF2586 family protein n=1 Tax=Limibacterium fermenti TaxID=3229863 RepID=UPI003A613723
MSLRGVTIKEGQIGANVIGDGREFGLITNGVAIAGKVSLGSVYTLRRVSDATALGIDSNYDASNGVQVYRHISEFFRRAGEGQKLHILLVAQTKKPGEMVDDAKTLAVESGGVISDMALAFNPAADYEDTLLDGINADIKAAIPLLQGFADWCDEKDMPLHVILEGRSIGDMLSACVDLRGLVISEQPFDAEKVTLVVGQDWAYADTLPGHGKKFADVGTFLGVVASMPWNRNPGEVETQNLTDSQLGVWTIGGLSNHKKYSEVFSELETLNDKGYVFPIRYQGIAGYWWNDGHCCVEIVNDAAGNMNQHTIYYSHTMDMCKRQLRLTYLPEVKKPVSLDDDGKLPQSVAGYFNAIGDGVFDSLASQALISDGETNVDTDSDLLLEKVLNIDFAVIPTGCVNEIKGTINLKNQ